MRPYFPGGGLNGFPSAHGALEERQTHGPHALQLGLPGYLIPFAPLAFAPHRQVRSGRTPSPLVVPQGLQHFTATPEVPPTSPGLKANSIPCTPNRWAVRFHKGLAGPATSALGPIIAATTRAAGITAAAGTSLTQPLFRKLLTLPKSRRSKDQRHLGFPRHACAHCGVFAPAAPRRTWGLVSVPISGLRLPSPVPVVGLVVRYTTNSLISRSSVLRRQSFQRGGIPASLTYGGLSSVSRGCPPPQGRLTAYY